MTNLIQGDRVELTYGYPRFNLKKGDRGEYRNWSANQNAPVILIDGKLYPIHERMFKKI